MDYVKLLSFLWSFKTGADAQKELINSSVSGTIALPTCLPSISFPLSHNWHSDWHNGYGKLPGYQKCPEDSRWTQSGIAASVWD